MMDLNVLSWVTNPTYFNVVIQPVVAKDLPISPRFSSTIFSSRCKFTALTPRQPMVAFYLLTFLRFPLLILSRFELTTPVPRSTFLLSQAEKCRLQLPVPEGTLKTVKQAHHLFDPHGSFDTQARHMSEENRPGVFGGFILPWLLAAGAGTIGAWVWWRNRCEPIFSQQVQS